MSRTATTLFFRKTLLEAEFCGDAHSARDSIRWCAVTPLRYIDRGCFAGVSDVSFQVGLLYLPVASRIKSETFW